MGKKSNLLRTFENASKETHERTFKFKISGEGTDVVCPRLSLKNQAVFERKMLEKEGKEWSGFSLSMLKNSSAMKMAECSANVLKELREEGVPEKFETEQLAKMYMTEFQARLIAKFNPYAQVMFGGFTKDDQIYAVTMALQQYYGDSETKTTGRGDSRKDEEIVIDDNFARVIFDAQMDHLETMFLWAIGLADIPDGTDTEELAKSLRELGGSGNVTGSTKKSATEGKSTTKTTSP